MVDFFDKKVWVSLVLVSVLIAGVAGVAYATNRPDDKRDTIKLTNDIANATATSTSTTQLASAGATTTAPETTAKLDKPAVARPKTLVAASMMHRLVLIDSTTGKTTKVLATDNEQTCFGITHVSLTPDSAMAYYEVSASVKVRDFLMCHSAIFKVSTSGGKATRVTDDGYRPEVSPDGKSLGYFRITYGSSMNPDAADAAANFVPNRGTLIVRDLKSSKERVVKDGVECCSNSPLFSWAPDNRHMVYQALNCGCGGTAYLDLNIIDSQTGVMKEVKLPKSIAKRAVWGDASYTPDGNLFLFELSNSYDEHGNYIENPPAPRMLLVNPGNSQVIKVITTGYNDRWYNSTDSDASGQHLMYMSANNLMVSDYGKRPSQLARGLYDADWN